MLSRKTSKLRVDLEGLREYASGLHALLGLKYVRAADNCLKMLSHLNEDPFTLEVVRSLNSEYSECPAGEDPRQLSIVELYWFFRHECRCSGVDSEVRVAVVANAFLGHNLAYIPEYKDGESQGCPAVRQAVRRYRPHTLS